VTSASKLYYREIPHFIYPHLLLKIYLYIFCVCFKFPNYVHSNRKANKWAYTLYKHVKRNQLNNQINCFDSLKVHCFERHFYLRQTKPNKSKHNEVSGLCSKQYVGGKQKKTKKNRAKHLSFHIIKVIKSV